MKKNLPAAFIDVPLFRKVERLRQLLRAAVFSFVFVLCSLSVHSQWVSIPDTGFGSWLNANNYDQCLQGNSMVGWQLDTTCNAVVTADWINIHVASIHDLTGIQYFRNLYSLWAGETPLTYVPRLPNSIRSLILGDSLSSLPPLPDSLEFLNCAGNQLTELPDLPITLTSLYCQQNLLQKLPYLPDSLYGCNISDNPIACLPPLKRIVNFEFNNTNIACIPNYGSITYSTPLLGSVSLCDTFNPNACSESWNISGKVYFDENGNCYKNVGEYPMSNVKVVLAKNGSILQQTSTGGEGYYSFAVDTFGAYTIFLDVNNFLVSVNCPSMGFLTSTITPQDSLDYSMDFAVGCYPSFDLSANYIWGDFFKPGNYSFVHMGAGDVSNFYGAHCASGVSGSVITTITGPASYISHDSGALAPIVNGNVLTYNIADFGTVNFFNDFNIVIQTDTTALLDSSICFTVSVTPTNGDNNPANNTLTHCYTVVASWDPNDKQVYPAADIDTAQEWLTYTIRFQNTGTAEAQHIYVTDTLDSDLDVSSFQLLAYSHQPMVQLKENAVRFNFPNINLPDSNANEPLSHGYVQYKIKLKDNLPIGTQINNTAFIYFDFNAPVVTNTTTNTIAVLTGISTSEIRNSKFEMFPNPANDAVTISVDESMIGGTVTITDVTGRKMAAVQLLTNHQSLITSNMTSGVYFVVVIDKEGRNITKRIVKAN